MNCCFIRCWMTGGGGVVPLSLSLVCVAAWNIPEIPLYHLRLSCLCSLKARIAILWQHSFAWSLSHLTYLNICLSMVMITGALLQSPQITAFDVRLPSPNVHLRKERRNDSAGSFAKVVILFPGGEALWQNSLKSKDSGTSRILILGALAHQIVWIGLPFS